MEAMHKEMGYTVSLCCPVSCTGQHKDTWDNQQGTLMTAETLKVMFLDCGEKSEYTEKNPTCIRRTCKHKVERL